MTTTMATTATTATPERATINTDSFEAVYAYLQPVMLRCVREALRRAGRTRRSSELAMNGLSPEDITQQTWLQVWRTWPTLRGRDRQLIASYALRIARNLVIDQQRRCQVIERKGQVTLTPDLWDVVIERLAPTTARDDQPETALLDTEALADLLAQVERLTARDLKQHAVPLLLGLLADETPAETAARLGITYTAAKMAKCRLRRVLKERLTAEARDEATA